MVVYCYACDNGEDFGEYPRWTNEPPRAVFCTICDEHFDAWPWTATWERKHNARLLKKLNAARSEAGKKEVAGASSGGGMGCAFLIGYRANAGTET